MTGDLSPSVAEAEDHEVGELVFEGNGIEGRLLAELLAEVTPGLEDPGFGVPGLLDMGLVGGLQSRAEISLELISDGSCSMFQGSGCG